MGAIEKKGREVEEKEGRKKREKSRMRLLLKVLFFLLLLGSEGRAGGCIGRCCVNELSREKKEKDASVNEGERGKKEEKRAA